MPSIGSPAPAFAGLAVALSSVQELHAVSVGGTGSEGAIVVLAVMFLTIVFVLAVAGFVASEHWSRRRKKLRQLRNFTYSQDSKLET